jgi:crotonobetainyl-CoA:carnitine CoA-transferase CaiB-like acyl-CoA transferase
MSAEQPLRGLRVVEVSQLIAAPPCGLRLANLGDPVLRWMGLHP